MANTITPISTLFYQSQLPLCQIEGHEKGQEDSSPGSLTRQGETVSFSSSEEGLQPVPGLPQFAFMEVLPHQAATEEGRQFTAGQMVEHLRRWPTLSAVISMVPDSNGNTDLIVAGRENAAEGSRLAGVYEVVQRLASSQLIKEEAKRFPTTFSTVRPFDRRGKAMAIRLPGPQSLESATKALQEGGKPNQVAQLQELIRNLPRGQRVVLLVGGPSAAGKSSLIDEVKKLAGDRKVAVFPGDMYFRDADDPVLPKTPSGSTYWDHPQAMHFDEMCEDIARLAQSGRADIPVYNFKDIRPGGWHLPGVTGTGYREERKDPLELGGDDILVIDSLHATSERLINKLNSLNLPHASVYLDSPQADVRLIRRLIRDYESRGRSPERTLSDWDQTTFPGEVSFVRPTILNLDPAQDVFLTRQFPKDLVMTREEINRKVRLLEEYGLGPSYEAFGTADEALPAFARSEAQRLREVLASTTATAAEKEKARQALEKIEAAQEKNPAQAA